MNCPRSIGCLHSQMYFHGLAEKTEDLKGAEGGQNTKISIKTRHQPNFFSIHFFSIHSQSNPRSKHDDPLLHHLHCRCRHRPRVHVKCSPRSPRQDSYRRRCRPRVGWCRLSFCPQGNVSLVLRPQDRRLLLRRTVICPSVAPLQYSPTHSPLFFPVLLTSHSERRREIQGIALMMPRSHSRDSIPPWFTYRRLLSLLAQLTP